MRANIDTRKDEALTFQQKAHVACFVILWIALLFFAIVMVFTMPARAAVINPSIHDKDPWWCENKITGWICPDRGAQGYQGINGTKGDPGEPNFTAIYYNATNFTAIANFTHFYNATNFNVTSNYTVINGASFYNTTAINESYAYLPGRAGGQTLNGGTTTGNLILNGSTNNGDIILQPNGGNVSIGGTSASYLLELHPHTGNRAYLDLTTDSSTFYSTISLTTYQSSILANDMDFSRYRGTEASPSVVAENDRIMTIRGRGYSALAGTLQTLANIRMEVDGVPDSGSDSTDMPGRMLFLTTPDGGNSALERLRITNAGNIGIGATAPTAQIHTTGTVRFANYGAGTATFDAGGNITSVSDSKAKTNIAAYPAGLAQILQLAPKQYKYSPDSGLDTQNTYVGFIAQDVEKVLPDAVKTKDDVKYEQKVSKKGATAEEDEYTTVEVKTGTQTKSLDDRAIIAALVNAVKEQQAEINTLNARIKTLEEKVK